MVYTLADGTQMTRRQKVILTGGTDGALTDYQLKLAISHAAGMQNGFDDLRLTQGDMQTLIDAWLEAKVDGISADVWGEFPSTPASGAKQTKGYMYYGNAGAANVWDGDATFEFFDDFEDGTIDTNKWNTAEYSGASVTESNGVVTLSDPSGNEGSPWMYSHGKFDMTTGMAVRTKWKYHMTSGDYSYVAYIIILNDGTFTNDGYGGYYANNGYQKHFNPHYSGITLAHGRSATLDTSSSEPTDDVWYISDLSIESGSSGWIRYSRDSSELMNWNGSYDDTTGGVTIGRVGGSSEQGYDTFEWIFVRKYTANPPTYTFSSEEHQRRMPMMM